MTSIQRFTLITLALSMGSGIFAQSYIPLLDTTATWQDQNDCSDLGSNITAYECMLYYLQGDTVVNDTAYHVLRRSGASGFRDDVYPGNSEETTYHGAVYAWLREDTIGRKVYYREPGWPYEFLFYDFSVGLGPYPWTYRYYQEPAITVTAVDTIILSDGPHRRMYLGNGQAEEDEVIEGLGGITGLIEFGCSNVNWMGQLACHTVNGTPNYTGMIDWGCGCDAHVGVKVPISSKLQIGPSPTSDVCRLEGASPGASFRVWAMDGRMVFTGRCSSNGSAAIDLADQRTGLYIVEVVGKTGLMKIKVIKE